LKNCSSKGSIFALYSDKRVLACIYDENKMRCQEPPITDGWHVRLCLTFLNPSVWFLIMLKIYLLSLNGTKILFLSS
ncbi:MAG: hypothetical protein QF915_05705, partial [Candidatus Woesearchaeota archaeon]|nr:hypothetical protein [Candidatus Woesearchaeota archaeon]